MQGNRPIRLRVHHALNFAQWIQEGRSDDDLRQFLERNGYDENVIEESVRILDRMRNPAQRVRILGYRDVRNDEVCKSCSVKKERDQCFLPPKEGYGDKDTIEAEQYDVYPSIFAYTSEQLQKLRPKRRRFFR